MEVYYTNEKKTFSIKHKADSGTTYQADVVVNGSSQTFPVTVSGDKLEITLDHYDPLSGADYATGFIRFYKSTGETIGRIHIEVYSPNSIQKDMEALQAIDAVIRGTATRKQSSYSINGRSISFMPVDELLRLRSYFYQKVYGKRKLKGYIF